MNGIGEGLKGFNEAMNYNETRNKYLEHRKNMMIAERDEMRGVMQIIPINDLNLKQTRSTIHKSSKKEISNIITTPKRTLILFVRDYLREFGRITAKGLARKHENIFRNTKRKPDKQLIKDFTVILKDLVDLGILKKSGSSRGIQSYTKIINPDKLEGLKNGRKRIKS